MCKVMVASNCTVIKPNFRIIRRQAHKLKERNGSCDLLLLGKGKAAACTHKKGNCSEQVAVGR